MAQPSSQLHADQALQPTLIAGAASVRVANVVVRMGGAVTKDAAGRAPTAQPTDRDKQAANAFASDVIFVTSEDLSLFSDDEDGGPVRIPTIEFK